MASRLGIWLGASCGAGRTTTTIRTAAPRTGTTTTPTTGTTMLGFGSPNLSRKGTRNVVSRQQIPPRHERCTLMSSVLLQTDRAEEPTICKTLPSGTFRRNVGKVFVYLINRHKAGSTVCFKLHYPLSQHPINPQQYLRLLPPRKIEIPAPPPRVSASAGNHGNVRF